MNNSRVQTSGSIHAICPEDDAETPDPRFQICAIELVHAAASVERTAYRLAGNVHSSVSASLVLLSNELLQKSKSLASSVSTSRPRI